MEARYKNRNMAQISARNMARILARILAMALVVAGLACTPRAPRRPGGIPAEAVWRTYGKEGSFLLVTPDDSGGWRVQAWSDHGGTSIADGLYVLKGSNRNAINADDIVGFDEGVVRLGDGGLLVPKS